jgi:hypothetical protein
MLEKIGDFFSELCLSVAITAGVYAILTAPNLCFIFFDCGFSYSMGACIICGIISAIIGHIISDKLEI